MSIKEKIKSFYYIFEDRYYDVLDRINKVIPVYKVIDPIDRHFPSFILFILLLVFLLTWFFILPALRPPQEYDFITHIEVLDNETKSPISGADVIIKLASIEGADQLNKATDSKGIATFSFKTKRKLESVEAKISISKKDSNYDEIKNKDVVLVNSEKKVFSLRKPGLVFKGAIEIHILKDAVGSEAIRDRQIIITFSCQRGSPPANINRHGSEQPFKVERPLGCEGLSATASAQGFNPATLSLENKEIAIFKLTPIQQIEEKGILEVTVNEHNDSLAKDVVVRVYDATTSSLVTQKTTTETGTALFEALKAGYYDVSAIASDNRTTSKQNVRVIANEKTQVGLKLTKPEPRINYKLFFKVIDSNSRAIIPDAEIIIYMDQFYVASVQSDGNGLVSYTVSEADRNKSFKIIVRHPNYSVLTISVPVLEISASTPTEIELMALAEYETTYLPVAIIKANKYYGSVPLTVEFDASQSFDPDGTIKSYEWDFGDGNKETGVARVHTYASKGIYFVKLRVKDESNLLGETSTIIQVGLESYAPVPIILADKYYGELPLTISFDGSSSFDPDGTIGKYTWKFCDGNTSNEKKPIHTYYKPGNYVVSLTVEDNQGKTSIAYQLIQVRKKPDISELYAPIAIFSADKYFGVPPLTVSFDASQSFDPDGTIKSYAWDFGDGTTATGKIAAHIFTNKGIYLVKLRVTDQNDISGESSIVIQVGLDSYRPISIIRADRYAGKAPLTVHFDGSYSFDPDGTIVSYLWEFDDGNTAKGPTTTRTFEKEGIYKVSLTVIDNNNKSDETEIYIQVGKIPVITIGKVLVRVIDLQGKPVSGAAVYLYREDLPFTLNTPGYAIYTDANGQYLYDCVEPSIKAYYAKALKDNLFGESNRELVSAGMLVTLTIVMSEDYGEIEAIVVDQNENKISGADVIIYNEIGTIEARCKTGLTGTCNSGPIKAGKMVYLAASKENYISSYSEQFQVIAKNLHSIKLVLYPKGPDSGIEMSFVDICNDWQCKETVSVIASDTNSERYYYAKFYLKLFANESTNIYSYLRAGLESQESIAVENYKIRIMEVRAPGSKIFYATCYNPSNKYEIKTNCIAGINSGSKMVLLQWNKLSGQNGVIVPIMLKFGVEKGLGTNEKLELRYAAKAIQFSTERKTDEKLLTLIIGDHICTEKKINWHFKLYSGNNLVKDGLTEKFATDLNLSKEYMLHYSIKNCTEIDYTGSKLEVWDENVANAISFPDFTTPKPHTLYASIPSLKPGQTLEDKVKIKAANIAEFTRVLFKLSKGADIPVNGTTKVLFRIISTKEMRFEGLPQSLPPNIIINITGYLKDSGTGGGVANATVEVSLNDVVLGTITTEANGRFTYVQPSGTALPKPNDVVKLKGTHTDYAPAFASIPVRQGGAVGISCITIKPSEPIKLNKGDSSKVIVITKKCPEGVAVKLESSLSLSQKEFTMGTDETKEVPFTASGTTVSQGIYPIYASARFISASTYKNIGIVDVIVNDPNSCFVMENYIYDMKSGRATGIIKNKCLYPNNDPDMPLITIANNAVELKYADKPVSITFKWRIKSEALENGAKSINITSYEATSTINLTTTYIADLAEFNAEDYIKGNASKGVKGLKQAPGYSGGKLCNVKFVPESDDSRVLVWIEGTKVMGRFIGEREERGEYSFTLINKGVKNTMYTFIGIDDYITR
ncbi:MAG: PKD domain-containing protein [Candidatus Diapherotrites archaeon]|nr:PKD domain-containing protein [Candidatus Diapherotrites archaeon]